MNRALFKKRKKLSDSRKQDFITFFQGKNHAWKIL